MLCESMTYTSPAPRKDSRHRRKLRPSFRTGTMMLTGSVTAGEVCNISAAGTVDPGSLHKGAAIACISNGVLRPSYWNRVGGKRGGGAQVCTLQSRMSQLFLARGVFRKPSPVKKRRRRFLECRALRHPISGREIRIRSAVPRSLSA